MEEIILLLEGLDFLDPKEQYQKLGIFYTSIANLKLRSQQENGFEKIVLPKIYNLVRSCIIKEDLMLLSLVATTNHNVLKKVLEYKERNFELNIEDSSSLFNYCIFKKKHWILEVIQNFSSLPKKLFSENTLNKLIVLKCLDTTVNEFDLRNVENSISGYKKDIELDPSLSQLIVEVEQTVEIIHFFKKIEPSIDERVVFNTLCSKTLLDAMSILINLKNSNNWPGIIEMLEKSETQTDDRTLRESQVFEVFTLFATVFNLEKNCKEHPHSMNNTLENVKTKILSFDNSSLKLELLENIFSILFLRKTHSAEDGTDSFVNNEIVVRSILHLVKSVFDEMKMKNLYSKGSDEYERFTELNKYLHDAFWRLELVTSVKKNTNSTRILSYMLASPTALLVMCMRKGNFVRAHQVLEIFNLKDTVLAKELMFCEHLRDIRNRCKKLHKLQAIKKVTPKIDVQIKEDTPEKLASKINDLPSTVIPRDFEDIVENSSDQNYLCHYKRGNEKFMNLVDLLCTQSFDAEISMLLLKLVKENRNLNTNIVSPYSKFCDNLIEISEKIVPIEDLSICDIILSPEIPFSLQDYEKQKQFDTELSLLFNQFKTELGREKDGVLNINHKSHKIFNKIEMLCRSLGNSSNQNNYLGKLFNYLKAFSKVLYIEENHSTIISKGQDTSFFKLLDYNRSELMGHLLFEKHLDPTEFEIYFSKMKLDFLYHLVGNCFPTINLHTEEFVTEEELFPENSLYLPSQNIIYYIMKRNWLLALILKEMYKVSDVKMEINESRIQAFLNYKNLQTTQNLKRIFEDNEITTALQHEICVQKIKNYMDGEIAKHNMTSSQTSNSSNLSLETGEEIIEDSLKSTDWKGLFDILTSVPEIQMKKNKELRSLKDVVACNIINERFEFESYKYLYAIDDRSKRLEIIMNNIKSWPAEFCLDVIKAELSKFENEENHSTEQLEIWQHTIELCEEISKLLGIPGWSKCQEILESDPEEMFKKLLNTCRVDLILKFISTYDISEESLKLINQSFIKKSLSKGYQLADLHMLLNKLPYDQSIILCNALIENSTDLEQLNFYLKYLADNTNTEDLEKKKIGLKILSGFSDSERESFINLSSEPLDIIEVLLMNMKFDKLAIVSDLIEENPEFTEKVDNLLRSYAEKSLDFRVVTQPVPLNLKTPESKLIESIDSSSSERPIFYMPDKVPSKEQWVQNNEVSECMCCQSIVFSMFNRRHHCRRCGRVVCFNCSAKRMEVDTYGDILVRVCNDCYEQTMERSVSSERSETISKDGLQDFWLLTKDSEHNKIVRDEFSYEHAPSVSLCLSILKYHSHSIEYPKFLLDQCNNMLSVLHPSQESLREIDYLLVIRMLKSLALAAKMMSQECSYHQGVSQADRLLNQVELLGLFSERGCLDLLPLSKNNQTPNIDAPILRRLREKLIEKEQWELALEVSTKAGLDRTGVFAAWGKSCLKAGCLTKAREKFQRCLDKRGRYESFNESIPETDGSEDGSLSGSSRNLNKSYGELVEKKPLKNPPLLNEIIHILESKTAVIDKNIVDEVNFSGISASITTLNQSSVLVQRDPSISILNKLRNLDYIASGKYYFPADRRVQTSYATNRPIVDTVFYNECIFYLSRYGSHQSLLEFYLKHGELDQALQYILDNTMSGEFFIEIYMRCLKEGLVNILQENIAKIDSTLDLWKNYLRVICRHLEKQKLLHSLYQLQLFMGDYMRAAMTCIRFYQENTKNFSDLARKNNFLHKAEEHLKQIHEQEQWIEVTPVRKISEGAMESYEEKSITNPSIVMKRDNKNINIYLNTIWRQNEVASFLADCEAAGMEPMNTLKFILPEDSDNNTEMKVPTLFDDNMDRVRLAILILVTSVEIEAGFKIVTRLIQEFKLRPGTVYCQTGKHLAKLQKYDSIMELVRCIKKEAEADKAASEMCDEMLTLSVATLTKEKAPAANVEDLIKLITDRATKISAYIEAKQLKTAYFFAVRFKRMSDIRRILREAELNNQPNIKNLCLKVLQAHSQSSSNSKE